jgi:hypothetical protein
MLNGIRASAEEIAIEATPGLRSRRESDANSCPSVGTACAATRRRVGSKRGAFTIARAPRSRGPGLFVRGRDID